MRQWRKYNIFKSVEIKESVEKPKEEVLKKIKIQQMIILIGLTKISLNKF